MMTKSMCATLVALFVSLGAAPSQGEEATKQVFEVPDLPFPASPAASALSRDAEPVLRPSTLREFATSLNGVVGKDGRVAKSISVAITPLAFKLRMPGDYQTNDARRIWENTQFSLATVFDDKADGKTASRQRIALGISVPLFDRADPRLGKSEWHQCIAKEVGIPSATRSTAFLTAQGRVDLLQWELDELKKQSAGGTDQAGRIRKATELATAKRDLEAAQTELNEFKTKSAALRTKCIKVHQDKAGNAAALSLAFAQTWADSGGEKPDLTRDARYAWLNYRGGVVDGQRYVLQARAAFDAIDEGSTPIAQRRYDSRQIAARYAFEEADNWHLSLAAANERRRFDATGKRNDVRTFIGSADFKWAKDSWLRLSVGRKRTSDGASEPVVNATFDWGFAKTPIESALDSAAR
jgi:hypothetical protein